MTPRFDGKVALVTGAARGIGYATAELFASEGAHVAVCDVAMDAATDAASRLRSQYGGKAIGLACDVTDEAGVDAMVQQVTRDLGGLDILVNNAGVTRDNLLFKMTVDDW